MRVSHNQTNGYLAASQQDETEERQHFSAVKQQRRKKTFVSSEKSVVMMEIMVSNISFMQHNSTKYTILKTSAHTYKTELRERAAKTKTNTQGLWPKAALSALVFILGSCLSVWLYELFMELECVGTTVQLLMKQSFGAAWLGNHRHNAARE